ncbi:hypothetical protein [Pseudomonas peli]|uniref:hypothetical protein n=1 Tax=Pseudomonas peli TaxID=592361 RepID=UPI0024ACA226|nr:hypothetical protein [Pseudomonas peli]
MLNGKNGPGNLFEGQIAGEAVLAVAGSLGPPAARPGWAVQWRWCIQAANTAQLANSNVDLSGDLTVPRGTVPTCWLLRFPVRAAPRWGFRFGHGAD